MAVRSLKHAPVQLREAEESGLIQRSAMTASVSLGLLTLAQGSFVGILDVSMFAADAASACLSSLPRQPPAIAACFYIVLAARQLVRHGSITCLFRIC